MNYPNFDSIDYQQQAKEWFNEHKFILCSFKHKNDFYEVLDISNWEWDKFDYLIPNYNDSKSWKDDMDNNSNILNVLN